MGCPRDDGLTRARQILGLGAELWAGPGGITVREGGWDALSGARSADYNVVLCHEPKGGGGLDEAVVRVCDAGVPAIVMVAGPALGEVQTLVERGWACVGSVSLMSLALGSTGPAPGRLDSGASMGRQLSESELDAAQALVGDVFGVGLEMGRLAIPLRACHGAGQAVWGAFDDAGQLVSCLATVRVREAVVMWSMATARAFRRRGFAKATMTAALGAAVGGGAGAALLYAAPEGEAFYRACGFRELERWQSWSRPRWALGRA